MKHGVFFGALLVGPWLVAALLRYLPMNHRIALAGLLAMSTYVVDINLMFDMDYRGMSRSLDISTIDIYALGLLLFLWWQRRKRGSAWVAPTRVGPVTPVIWSPALTWAFALFLAMNVVSLLGAASLRYGLFDMVKLVRGFVLFWIAANLVRDDGMAESLPSFLGIFATIEILAAAKDYVDGFYWVAATVAHKNEFAFAMNVILPFLLARALIRPQRRLLFAGLFAAGAVCVVISRSRTAWMTMALAVFLVTVLCLIAAARHGTRQDIRRMGVVVLSLGALALPVGGKLADGIIGRWDESAVASMDFRVTNNEIALEMARKYPFGVGTNNYVVMLGTSMGERLPELDRTVAHNVYFYVAAELGWVGLAVFLLLLGSYGFVALRLYLRATTLRSLYVSVGALAGFFGAMVHSSMESGGLLRSHTYFIWCLVMGLVVGVAHREGHARVSPVRWLIGRRNRRFATRSATRGRRVHTQSLSAARRAAPTPARPPRQPSTPG